MCSSDLGDVRGALSLLYRGALRVLIYERDLEVRAGDTEGDCVRRVSRAGPGALAAYFSRLVEAWGLIAYARRDPAVGIVDGLIDEWVQFFMTPTSSSADRRTGRRSGASGARASTTAPTTTAPTTTAPVTPATAAARAGAA